MVKVFEVTEQLPFDKIDDLVVYMRNDPEFYRKQYFPTMCNVADMQREGTNDNPQSIIMPMIEKAIGEYCQKFQIARHVDDVFDNNDRTAVFDKIYKEEMEQIEKGEYK